MVSSISSLFRNRRPRQQTVQKAIIVTSSTIPATSSNLIPIVEITSAEPMATSTEEIVVPYSKEIVEETIRNGKNGEVKVITVVETEEEIPQCGCAEVLQNGLVKVKAAVEEIPPEYKEAARYSGLVTASLAGLFVSIVLLRVSQHLLINQDTGFFCTYFSRPFAPLFDALCHPTYPGVFNDFSQESQHLASEVHTAFKNFFASLFAGFKAFGTIFWALFGGVLHVISDGTFELYENVTENLAFLFKFFCDFTNSLISILYRVLTGIIAQIGIAAENFGKVLTGDTST